MPSGMKYIMFDNGMDDVPVVFPNSMGHGDMLQAIRAISDWEVVSAGFVQFGDDGKAWCNGSSIELKNLDLPHEFGEHDAGIIDRQNRRTT